MTMNGRLQFMLFLVVGANIVQSKQQCLTEKQMNDLTEVEESGYKVVNDSCKALIYNKDGHIPTILLSTGDNSNCTNDPNSYWDVTEQQCVCKYEYYRDELTGQCQECVRCCDKFKDVIKACVNQGQREKICEKVRPCYPAKEPSWYNSNKNILVPVFIGVGGLTGILVILVVSWKIGKKVKAQCDEGRHREFGAKLLQPSCEA
ncbi:uncharacterized protein LOC144453970 [Glandiceps talaboti]